MSTDKFDDTFDSEFGPDEPTAKPNTSGNTDNETPRQTRLYDLAEVHDVFRRWLGDEYDLDTLNTVLAAAAAERLAGDPLWLLVVSGPGNAKTETVQALRGAGAHVTSTIASEGALLSAVPKRNHAKDATGGLLRKLGDRGLLVIKDVTSILSAHREVRSSVLAAIREIYDGRWERNVGTDGGKTLTWEGRLAIVGAVTTAWDSAHSVIATMGDRFVLIRANSRVGRLAAGRRAIRNIGHEVAMREELATAVGGLIATVEPNLIIEPTEQHSECILAAANMVALARTGVETDYRGDVINAHEPEMPTRLVKQLTQVFRGAVAINMSKRDALALAIRCARDCVPPLRLEVLLDVAEHPHARVIDIRRRLEKPRATTDRTLQALHIMGLLTCEEIPEIGIAGRQVHVRYYSVANGINLSDLTVPDLSTQGVVGVAKEEEVDWEEDWGEMSSPTGIDISGNAKPEGNCGAGAVVCVYCHEPIEPGRPGVTATSNGEYLHTRCVDSWSRQP